MSPSARYGYFPNFHFDKKSQIPVAVDLLPKHMTVNGYPMRRNLVVLQMNGLSELLFQSYWAELPALSELADKSLSFTRFYTSSTSRIMSLADFFYGDSDILDHYTRYPENGVFAVDTSDNLFAILHRRGYECTAMHYSHHREEVDGYHHGLWPECCGEVTFSSRYEDFLAGVAKSLECRAKIQKPFALHLLNDVAEAKGIASMVTDDALSGKYANAMRLLNESMGVTVDALRGNDLLGTTFLVVLGVHGSELWFHGFHGGFMFGLEPYASQCQVPLLIHTGADGHASPALFSMVDLKPTLLHMLFPGETPENQSQTLSNGFNLHLGRRMYAFSQSVPALFRESLISGDSLGVVKSYAVNDGSYRLVATSGKGPKNSGMELFCDPLDPDNTSNLLDFAEIDSSGAITRYGREDARHPHYLMNMTPDYIQNLVAKYNELSGILKTYIREKENIARKMIGGEVYGTFSMRSFAMIRDSARH
jgi:hypothetical protein